MTDHKTPPSEMIRVPTALIGVVRQLSKLHRQGHTIGLLQALEELVSQFDSNIDISIASSQQRLSQLEQKTEAIAQRLAQLEGAIASTNNQEAKLEELSHKLARFEGALIQMQSSMA